LRILSNMEHETLDIFDQLDLHLNKDENFFVDIKMVQRNGKKSITMIENLFAIPNLNVQHLIKIWKKKFACNVFINEEDNEKIIKMTGNHVLDIQKYLIDEKICPYEMIRIH